MIRVEIPASPSQGLPEFKGDLERINVILGANGAGKSKLLEYLSQQSAKFFGNDRNPVLVEGGRAMRFDVSVGMNAQSLHIYSNTKQAKEGYRSNRRSPLGGRLSQTFFLLHAMEQQEKIQFSDDVERWASGEKTEPMPRRAPAPLERLAKLFQDVFPYLSLEVTGANQLFIRRASSHYPASSVSDGERQVLTLLADIAVLTNESSVFLVDEPELNLHPTLAEKLWTSIEQSFPNDLFVYATHSLSFAMRSDVESVYALGHGKLDMRAEFSREIANLRPFLGAIPGIIRTERCLFVEGDDASFDRPFYQWLLSRRDVEIVPVGSSSDVAGAASRQGIWNQLSANLRIAGVVDLDFKTSEGGHPQNVVTLKLHEAESYLCHPDVVVALHNSLGNTGHTISSTEIADLLIKKAQERLAYVVAQRVYMRTQINLRLSMERTGIKTVSTVDQLRVVIASIAKSEAQKALNIFDETRLAGVIDEEEASCNRAINDRNVIELLTIFEGKEALWVLCKSAGCPTPIGMLGAAQKHLDVDSFPHLKEISTALVKLIS